MGTQTSQSIQRSTSLLNTRWAVLAVRQHVTELEFFESVEFFQFRTEPRFCKNRTETEMKI